MPKRQGPLVRWRPGSALAALLLTACGDGSALQFDPGVQEPRVPEVAGLARYEDRDRDGMADAGDVLIVPFNTAVVVRGASVLDFELPVGGDSFGGGATLAEGPAANEVTITLGDGASLKTRQAYSSIPVDVDPASGIDLADMLAADVLENPDSGLDARASRPIDLVPGFVDSGQRLGNEPTRALALGDVDGDRHADLIEGNFRRPNRVWLNDGFGNYPSPTTQLLGNGATRAVLLVDVDGDADLDLLVANAEPEPDELWANDGRGAFTLRQVFGDCAVSCDSWGLTAGDLDGDGDPDLVVADGMASNVVWENRQGLFIFREDLADDAFCPGSAFVPPGCPTRAVALADVDRDGRLDVIEGNWDERDLLRFADSDGLSFGEPLPIGSDSGATTSLAVGDLDLDGDVDLVVGDGLGADRVWFNGGGGFADSGQRLGTGPTSAVGLADLDHDGALDLVTATRGGGNRFWLNDRRGGFTDSRQSLGSELSTALALGDVDGDQDIDWVSGNENAPNRVWLQSLTGTWGAANLSSPTALGNGTSFWAVSAVDVDQDGDADLVAAGPGASSSTWRNDGSGVFARMQILSPAVDSRSIAAADIDGDGDTDLIQGTDGDPSPDRLWINDGAGIFSATEEIMNSHSSLAVLLVDLDGDGDPDYVQSDEGPRVIKVWTNDGGSFTDTLQAFDGGPTTGTTLALAAGDVDRDGALDLVEAYNIEFGHVWRNDGTAHFAVLQQLGLSNVIAVRGLALGDLDLDGDVDLVSTDTDANNRGNHVWINSGGGLFTESGQSLAGRFFSIALADLDGDGDLDVISGGFQSTGAWFRNDGLGTFGSPVELPSGAIRAQGVITADFDRDGDVDVIVALQGTGTPSTGRLEVWLNR